MEVSRTETQTLTAGGYVIFNDDIVIPPSRCMYYNKTTGLTTLIGKTSNNNCYAVFKVTYTATQSSSGANTVSTTAIAVDDVAVEKSEMTVTSASTGNAYNVAKVMYIKVPKGTSSKVGIQAQTVADVSNAILIIERVS